jgi:GNAT superfamily N-acetyltransferase
LNRRQTTTADIRAGVPRDAGALTTIALAAKRYWGYPEEWLRLWQQDLVVTERYIQTNPVYVAEAGDEPIGFVGLDMCPQREEVDHMWVLPQWMGKGIGRRLMQHALTYCGDAGVGSLRVTSDPHVTKFYSGLGAVYEGEVPSSPAPRTIPLLRFDIDKSIAGRSK